MDPLKDDPLATESPVDEAKKKDRKAPANLQKMREQRRDAMQGSPERLAAQKAKGKLTARERIQYLLDEESFSEQGLLVRTRATEFDLQKKAPAGDGVITGFGKIAGRDVAVFAQDFTALGGSLGLAHAQKICRLMDAALEARVPVIGLLDSGGARIQEGVDSLDGYAEIFYRNVKSSGVIPQISVILGPCAGGAVYSPALTDFVFMVEGVSHMFVTGPEVVKQATGETVDFETLGGSAVHSAKSGVCHFVARSEPDCFRQVRELLSFLPQSRWEKAPTMPTADPDHRRVPIVEKLCELDPRKAYRVHHGIWQIADDKKFLEVHYDFAKNVVTGFLRLGGETIGVIANNPAQKAGALDIQASEKAARFIRFCDNFNIPLLTLVDVPGYWPGVEQEHGGIIRKGAKLLFAYSEATVPKVTTVLRKAYGGAYIAMCSKHLHGDVNFALPSAEIAVMGPKGAVEILYSRELKAAGDKSNELKEKLSAEYAERFASPYQTASSGSVDEVIEPSQLRSKLVRAFRLLRNKRRPGEGPARGNIPL
jgi:propionyl-CoA carboxylase beta chain